MMTRMVSPWPLSNFVPDVTLIAFQFPLATAGAVAEHFPHANSSFASRHEESVLILIVRAKFRRKPEFALGGSNSFRRLSASAQQITLSKLYNYMIYIIFLFWWRHSL